MSRIASRVGDDNGVGMKKGKGEENRWLRDTSDAGLSHPFTTARFNKCVMFTDSAVGMMMERKLDSAGNAERKCGSMRSFHLMMTIKVGDRMDTQLMEGQKRGVIIGHSLATH